jgi:hypothetical protein
MIFNYKNVSKSAFIKKYFDIINTAQPNPSLRYTESEIETLTEFLLLPPTFEHHRFSSLARSKVVKSLKEKNVVASRQTVNNKIYALIRKKALWKDRDKVIYMNPTLLKGVKQGLKAYDLSEDFKMIFQFTYDKQKPASNLQVNSKTDENPAFDSSIDNQASV